LLFAGQSLAQKFSIQPEKPQANQKVRIGYQAENGLLAKATEVNAMIRVMTDATGKTQWLEVPMTQAQNEWQAEVTLPANALSLLVCFESGKDQEVGKAGYTSVIYNAQDQVVPTAYSSLANGLLYFGSYEAPEKSVSEADLQKVLTLFEQEAAQFPQSRNAWLGTYTGALKKLKSPKAAEVLDGEIARLEALTAPDEQALELLHNLYNQKQDGAKSKPLGEKIAAQYPKGKVARNLAFFKALASVSPGAINDMTAKFEVDPDLVSSLYQRLAAKYIGEKKYDSAAMFLPMIPNKSYRYAVQNSLAWQLAETKTNLQQAADLAKVAYEYYQEQATKATDKPADQTTSGWKENAQWNMGMVADTYGYALTLLERYDEAATYLEIAVKSAEMSNLDYNQRYITALLKSKRAAETQGILEEMVRKGKANATMKTELKNLYIKSKGSDNGYDVYLAGMEKQALEALKSKVAKKQISQDTPNFELLNLKGEKVSLASLQGKVVVVDFWATWCGPCIKSFPAMKRAQLAHQDRSDVVFLFVNTWENGTDIETRVKQFLEKRELPFNVLMDSKNEMVAAFGVKGIPAKFIIDKEGKTRFFSMGFGSNEDEAVEELRLMIEIAGSKAQ
jgi:peroxiredoxin